MKRKRPYLNDSLDPYKNIVYNALMMNIELMKKDVNFNEDMLKIIHVMSLLNTEYIRTDLLTRVCQVENEVVNDFITVSSSYSLCTKEERIEWVYLNVHRLVLEVSGLLLNEAEQRYKTDLLVNTVKYIINEDLCNYMWYNHRDFILKHNS